MRPFMYGLGLLIILNVSYLVLGPEQTERTILVNQQYFVACSTKCSSEPFPLNGLEELAVLMLRPVTNADKDILCINIWVKCLLKGG